MEVIPVKLPIKDKNFDLFKELKSAFNFCRGDIIVISSKYAAIGEGAVIDIENIKVSPYAENISKRFNMDKKLAEVVLRESDYILKGIPGFVLSVKGGLLAPNAGVDKSNISKNKLVLYPKNPFLLAEKLRLKFLIFNGIRVSIIISDSRLMPTRKGTVGVCIGLSGFEPVEDLRGNKDLFGNTLRVTMKAVADGLSAAAVYSMGESNESTPVVVIRGASVIETDRRLGPEDLAIDHQQDLFIR